MKLDRRAVLAGSAAVASHAASHGPARAGALVRDGSPTPDLPAPEPMARAAPPIQDPSRLSLDDGWLFHEGDIAFPAPATHDATYQSTKAGHAAGAAGVVFDDTEWTEVSLPHDWASFQAYDPAANISEGYRRRGVGWYRRAFRLEEADQGRYLELQFGAAAGVSDVWVNGVPLVHSLSGYTSIHADITPLARYGEASNQIAVRVDASVIQGWWYEGAGLYRHAWLAKRGAISLATDGVHADPRPHDGGSGWSVPVALTLYSIAAETQTVSVEARLLDPAGRLVAAVQTALDVPPLESTPAQLSLETASPALWSVEDPALYTLQARVLKEGAVLDERRVPLGFRTLRFDPDHGFQLNGRPLKIKGVCLHQDHAGVGVAVPDALWDWRIERVKAMGCNAIRCSHNAPAEEFLDACDRQGMLVMDENRLFDTGEAYVEMLRWMVRRDRNHPSVILWSVFNEEPMQGTLQGREMVRRLVSAVRELDTSRPVTAAQSGGYFEPHNVSQAVDVVGFNYNSGDYDRFHALHPSQPLFSSEDTSAMMTRGAYLTDRAAHVASAFDTDWPDWGDSLERQWAALAARPFMAGGFSWTGFDYHGEPAPFGWPSTSSFFGVLDLCGFAKTGFDIRAAQWVEGRPVIAVAPHWTWPGREGEVVEVMAPTNAERVSLHLNGRLVGEAAVDPARAPRFPVRYQPGRLEALAWRQGRVVARAAVETTGAPVRLRLTPARWALRADGVDAQPVTVDAVDARGRHVPTANLPIRFEAEGLSIIGLGNGDPNSQEPEKGDARSLFNGLAQVIVQAPLRPGRARLGAASPGLRPATVELRLQEAKPRPFVPVAPPGQPVTDWLRAPPSATPLDPMEAPAAGDVNSWQAIAPGALAPTDPARRFLLLGASVTPFARTRRLGGRLLFSAVAGRAEVFVAGRRVAQKADFDTAPLSAPLPPGPGPWAVRVRIEAGPDGGGLAGPVWVHAASVQADATS